MPVASPLILERRLKDRAWLILVSSCYNLPIMESQETGLISIEEFMKVQIIAAKVLTCERVEGTEKLLKLTVHDGTRERVMVAGVAHHYAPEFFVGRTLPIVANLKPAKVRGILSEGMILAAEDASGNLSVVVLDKEISAGTRIH